jgi:hypothetical protein
VKIAYVMATRGRPHQALACVEIARMLASGKHDVEYVLAIDSDDVTAPQIRHLRHCTVSEASRPLCPPEAWNRAIKATDADVYLHTCDDAVVIVDNWDATLAQLPGLPGPNRLLMAANNLGCPNVPTMFMASREWIDLVDGELLDPLFPFWFSDTAAAELWSLVTGEPFPIAMGFQILTKGQQPNPGLRDMDFWWQVYAARRRDRLAKAAEIRAKLGMPLPATLGAMIKRFEERDRHDSIFQQGLAAKLLPSEPSERYLVARKRAEDYLAER